MVNWISKFKKSFNKIFRKQEKIDPSSSLSLWETCPKCSAMNYKETLEVDQDWICNKCSYYFDKPARATIKTWFPDGGTFIEPPTGLDDDPLNWKTETINYKDKLAIARKREKQWCSILGYKGVVENLNVHLVCSNFKFLGGSWDNNVSFYFRKIVSDAIENHCDLFVLMLKTGGVSMYHSAVGLNSVMIGCVMDMQRLAKNNILTVSCGQSKTTGGVLASVVYNSDIVLYEKGAHDVSFAGKRISKNYLMPGETISDSFATAEEKLATGMADLVLSRSELKPVICRLAKIIKKKDNLSETEKKLDDSTDTIREVLPRTAEKI